MITLILFSLTSASIVALVVFVLGYSSRKDKNHTVPEEEDILNKPEWETRPLTEQEKDYLKKQEVRLAQLRSVGDKDFFGETITRIHAFGNEYVIYEIATNNVSDSIKVWCDSIIEYDRTIGSRFDGVKLLYGKAKELLYKVKDDATYRSRIALLVSYALSTGKVRQSNELLHDLIKEIYQDSKERYLNSLKYLLTVILLVLSLIGLSLHTYSDVTFFKEAPLVRLLIYVVTAGSIGGMFSVSLRLRKMTFEKEIPPYAYALFGFERFFISILASFIVLLAIKSGIAFASIGKDTFGCALVGVLAGFSETFIPNLLVRIEGESEKNSK